MIERLLLIGSIVLVLIVELVNSGVEAAIDRISFEHHGLSKRAKDYGSAAVMLALLVCGGIWVTLLWKMLARGVCEGQRHSAGAADAIRLARTFPADTIRHANTRHRRDPRAAGGLPHRLARLEPAAHRLGAQFPRRPGRRFASRADATGRKSNLFASIGPAEEGGLVLSGHTDVVPVDGQTWSSDPFKLTARGSRLHARGACDMKGFIAAALSRVPAWKAAKLSRPVHLMFSYDEEVGCLGAPVDDRPRERSHGEAGGRDRGRADGHAHRKRAQGHLHRCARA